MLSLKHALSLDGVILAMIGKEPEPSALEALKAQAEVTLKPLVVPGQDAERYLAEIVPKR